MRVKSLLATVIIAALPGMPAVAVSHCTAAQQLETAAVRLVGLNAAGDPVLSDGRTLRLVGLAPRQDGEEAARFRAGLEPFRDRALDLAILGEPDRWGRWPSKLFIPADRPSGERQELALLLQRNGAALPLPEPLASPCSAAPVQATLSSTPSPSRPVAIDGHDLAAVRAQEGRYVMLEGRIASVGERSQRTYLNFSRRPGEAASIVVSRALWRELKGAGWTTGSLGGKRVRAYGVLSGRDGLLLEATSRAALELID
ncbi:hypothetical protein FQV39_17745 [Bosea sp. F3-2]|uniref:hypothetical protein n=1 Tax=Bosea sp. F3-2 TaxID=2599640 RepID=UPI0011EE6508|nr:hypothetical protein [Bosea sp. F3-2]QEL24216.1 hypothetical protein FQV39_17745 [Bosea sp. F3-2]